MDLNLIKAVYALVTGKPGHPNQFPYIDSWLEIAQDPPKWARFYAHGGEGKILMAQKVIKDEEEILQDPEGDELPPPPYWTMIPPASNTAATGGPTGGTSPRLVGLLDSSTVPTAPQVIEPPPGRFQPQLEGQRAHWTLPARMLPLRSLNSTLHSR